MLTKYIYINVYLIEKRTVIYNRLKYIFDNKHLK